MPRFFSLLACALAVAGCAGSPDAPPVAAAEPASAGVGPNAAPAASSPDADTVSEGRADRVQVARWTPTEVRMVALATGTLAVVDGCLGLAWGDGETMVVAFPYDAAWDDAVQTLTFEGDTHALGDTLALGGGGVEPDSYRLGLGAHDFPPCVTGRVWLAG